MGVNASRNNLLEISAQTDMTEPEIARKKRVPAEKTSADLLILIDKLLNKIHGKLSPFQEADLITLQTNAQAYDEYTMLMLKAESLKIYLQENREQMSLQHYREQFEAFEELNRRYKNLIKNYLENDREKKSKPISTQKKQTAKAQNKPGFWSQFLPDYVGEHFVLIGTIITFILGITAIGVGGPLGVGIMPTLLVFILSLSGAFYYYTLEGKAFKKMLRKKGEELDNLVLKDFFWNNKWKILKYLFIAAMVLTAVLLVTFPPATAFASLLAMTGLPTAALALGAGLAALMATQIIFWIGNFVIQAATQAYQALSGKQTELPEQKPKIGFWEKSLVDLLGLPMGAMGSIVEGAFFGSAVAIILVGTGGVGTIITGLVVITMGAIFYSLEVSAGQEYLQEKGKELDNLSWKTIKDNKWKIVSNLLVAGTVLAIATGITAMVLFPPAGIAVGVSTAIGALGLGALGAVKLGALTFVTTAVITNAALQLAVYISEYFTKLYSAPKKVSPNIQKTKAASSPPPQQVRSDNSLASASASTSVAAMPNSENYLIDKNSKKSSTATENTDETSSSNAIKNSYSQVQAAIAQNETHEPQEIINTEITSEQNRTTINDQSIMLSSTKPTKPKVDSEQQTVQVLVKSLEKDLRYSPPRKRHRRNPNDTYFRAPVVRYQ